MIAVMSALVNVDVPRAVELSTCDMESILQDFESMSPMVHQDSIASNNSSYVTPSKKEQSKVKRQAVL